MAKNNAMCGAAGLRHSAIAERLRLREEWSALKDIPGEEVSEVLRGVVVLVEVGSETRALPLRAALTALGASVVPAWSPLVTHLVWTRGGCRKTRAKARETGCQLISPLWVEACAAEGKKLPEGNYPALSRPSDLPSPATQWKFLKKLEHDKISLHTLLSDSQEEDKRPTRLRLSSETDHDTSRDTSHDKSRDSTKDTSHESIDIETRVNTAPRRRRTEDVTTKNPVQSKRKLFTNKELDMEINDVKSDSESPPAPKKMTPSKMTQRDRKHLAQAEKMARKLIGACRTTQTNRHIVPTQRNNSKPLRIVLTGMSRKERNEAWLVVKQLHGKVQQYVDRNTNHVIMGSSHEPENNTPTAVARQSPKTIIHSLKSTIQSLKTTRQSPKTARQSPRTTRQSPRTTRQPPRTTRQSPRTTRQSPRTTRQSPRTTRQSLKTANSPVALSICNKCNSPRKILSKMFKRKVTVDGHANARKNASQDVRVMCHCDCDISGVKDISDSSSDSSSDRNVRGLKCANNNIIHLDSYEKPHNDDAASYGILGLHAENGGDADLVPNRETQNDLGRVMVNHRNDLDNVVNIERRTANALLGAARGCPVLEFDWLKDSLRANRWLQHIGYEVKHLKKISQKARVERSALNKMNKEYSYNVFNGMRVKISPDAEQKDAITQLLTLCGAIIVENNETTNKNDYVTQDGGKMIEKGAKIKFSHLVSRTQTQNGGRVQDGGTANFDLTIGKGKGEVNSVWVFDSVAAAEMRTTRRYIYN